MIQYIIEIKEEVAILNKKTKMNSNELKNQKNMLYYLTFILLIIVIINTINYINTI